MAEVRREFGTILPDKRVAVIAGEEIDLTVIPTRMLLSVMDKAKEARAENNLEKSLDLVVEVCRQKNPKITREMLLELSVPELTEFIEFVMEPIRAIGKKTADPTGDTKNAESLA